MRFRVLMVMGLVVLQAGCQSRPLARGSSRLPVPEPARLAEFPPGDAAAGSRLYAIKCAKCHEFYTPAAYPEAEWRGWMTKMSRKARLEPDQRELLARYLELFRPRAGAPAVPPR